MFFLENVIAGVVSGISVTAIVSFLAFIWRKRVINKYMLSQQAKYVLAALWDEDLVRPSSKIAVELNVSEQVIEQELDNLKAHGLVRIRKYNDNGNALWKITWKGQEYLSQCSWLGDLL